MPRHQIPPGSDPLLRAVPRPQDLAAAEESHEAREWPRQLTASASAAERVSVVVPAYNAEATLADTLESLLRQTHELWEAIVVDDGSSDGTSMVATTFAARDARIRLVRGRHGGEAAARNEGLSRATGEWVLFLDSDDWIEPTHLERMLAAASATADVDAVHCGYARVAQDGSRVVELYEPPVGDLFSTLAHRAAFPVHACLIRRSKLEEIGGFDTSLKTSTDWDLWQRIARTGARFGAVRETLAMYRMQPQSASLNACQLFDDGLEVLQRGHGPDARVTRPLPEHANGLPSELIGTQVYYLLSWCAGLLIGAGRDPRPLFERAQHVVYADLDGDAIAQCLFESAMLPGCQGPEGWVEAWGRLQKDIAVFLIALETQSRTSGLATRASTALGRLILERSLAIGERRAFLESERRYWKDLLDAESNQVREHEEAKDRLERERGELRAVVKRLQADLVGQTFHHEEVRGTLEQERDDLRASVEQLQGDLAGRTRQHEEMRAELERESEELRAVVQQPREGLSGETRHHEEASSARRSSDELQEVVEHQQAVLAERTHQHEQERRDLSDAVSRLKTQHQETEAERQALAHDRQRLQYSLEQRLGSLLINDFGMRRAAEVAESLRAASDHRKARRELRAARRHSSADRSRVLTTVCSEFPIYSQTFVHREIAQLARNGFDVRLLYSTLGAQDSLGRDSAELWNLKHRMRMHRPTHEADYAWYRDRLPVQVETLTGKLCEASGMSRDTLTRHDNFLQAFSFTRLTEAFRPHYLHSYFFYDRSLMALVAGFLLGIPRGMTCYADHLLNDYELKLVPLHLELCDFVVATSQRIKDELIGLAPNIDPQRIIVKPNAVDVQSFRGREPEGPTVGEPTRLVCTSRIDPKKGLIFLVEAVSLLRQRGHNVELHLVGGTDAANQSCVAYKGQLDGLITTRNLWGKVHLEGQQTDEGVRRFLEMSHIFVAPFVETTSGDKDGIPTALLEAMASGLPVVTTDAGSISEVITRPDEGVIVPQRNSLALADAIGDLLSHPERRRELGRRAIDVVRGRFDVRVCEGVFHDRLRAAVQVRAAAD